MSKDMFKQLIGRGLRNAGYCTVYIIPVKTYESDPEICQSTVDSLPDDIVLNVDYYITLYAAAKFGGQAW